MAKMTLKAARINAGYNQSQAASLLNVTKTTLVKWEKGTTFPNALAIKRICSVYNICYDDISFLPSDSFLAK